MDTQTIMDIAHEKYRKYLGIHGDPTFYKWYWILSKDVSDTLMKEYTSINSSDMHVHTLMGLRVEIDSSTTETIRLTGEIL